MIDNADEKSTKFATKKKEFFYLFLIENFSLYF